MIKNYFFLFSALFVATYSIAQNNTFPSSGKVGIGTNNPIANISISGSGDELYGSSISNLFRLSAGIIGDNLDDEISLGSFGFKGSASNNISLGIRGVRIGSGNAYSNTAIVLGFDVDNSIREGGYIALRQGGNVGIGTSTPDAKLTVNGKVHAKEVRVDLNVPGADYVFEKSYPLRPLAKVSKYISVNHHLPDMPSAKSMEQNGIDVSGMNMKLLQKVEELTLYLIEMKKENELLNKRLRKVENRK